MTTPRSQIVSALEARGVVAVIRLADASMLQAVTAALVDGGVTAVEITMTVPRAVELIAELTGTLPVGAIVGAGTVLDAATARDVIAAGARFVVSPIFKPELIDLCHAEDVPMLPGCFTPTEIYTAWSAGADVVKVFPSTALGPTFFKDLRGPLPQVRLMPTGGVTAENAGDWIRAGAVAIGVGTALVDQATVNERRFDRIRDRARHFVDAVAQARGRSVEVRA